MTATCDSIPPYIRSLWLFVPVICCGLAGCGGSTTTLAIECPQSTPPETAVVKEDPKADEPAAPTETTPSAPSAVNQTSAAISDPVPASSNTGASLQPKLSMVDPARIIGRWRDSFFGTRTLSFHEDGTAHMRLDFDFAGRLLYGNRLDFDMKWSLEGGVVTIDIVDGQPAKVAKSAIETWGKRYVYLLDQVEDNKVEMRDGKQATSYTLVRLPDGLSSEMAE